MRYAKLQRKRFICKCLGVKIWLDSQSKADRHASVPKPQTRIRNSQRHGNEKKATDNGLIDRKKPFSGCTGFTAICRHTAVKSD